MLYSFGALLGFALGSASVLPDYLFQLDYDRSLTGRLASGAGRFHLETRAKMARMLDCRRLSALAEAGVKTARIAPRGYTQRLDTHQAKIPVNRISIAFCCSSILLASCVSAPRQTVELADVVAEQSASLETAHRQIVDAYFVELERRIDDFVDNRWAPDFLARAVASDQVRNAMQEARAGLGIDPDRLRTTILDSQAFSTTEAEIIIGALDDAQFDYQAQFGQIMLDFAQAALQQINIRRRDLKAPLEENRRRLLRSLDEGYADLRAGQAALRAYLASVVELVERQDRVLEKLSLIEQRDAAMDAAVEASDSAAEAAERLLDASSRFDGDLDED